MLQSAGLHCPLHHNPAELLLHLAQVLALRYNSTWFSTRDKVLLLSFVESRSVFNVCVEAGGRCQTADVGNGRCNKLPLHHNIQGKVR